MLQAITSAMRYGTTGTPSRRQTRIVTGATSSTVVTLSSQADNEPVATISRTISRYGLPRARRAAQIAMNSKIPVRFSTATISIMPSSRNRTFQSMPVCSEKNACSASVAPMKQHHHRAAQGRGHPVHPLRRDEDVDGGEHGHRQPRRHTHDGPSPGPVPDGGSAPATRHTHLTATGRDSLVSGTWPERTPVSPGRGAEGRMATPSAPANGHHHRVPHPNTGRPDLWGRCGMGAGPDGQVPGPAHRLEQMSASGADSIQ